MYKTSSKTIGVMLLAAALAACASQPGGRDFLADASATCGARDLFRAERTFISATSTQLVDRTYDCVNDYLNNLPEYRASASNQAADRQFIAVMRQIDTARAMERLTPVEAQG